MITCVNTEKVEFINLKARIKKTDTNTLVDLKKFLERTRIDLLEEINNMDNRINSLSPDL